MAVDAWAIDVADVVNLVWATTLELPLQPLYTEGPPLWAEPAMEAQVQITGDWQGVVVLHAAPALVDLIAQRMFRLGEERPSVDDARDAFGELANITGGNIKGLVSDGGAHLSLPTVVHGRHYAVSVPGSRQVARGVFSCFGQPLVITVLQASAAPPIGGESIAVDGAEPRG